MSVRLFAALSAAEQDAIYSKSVTVAHLRDLYWEAMQDLQSAIETADGDVDVDLAELDTQVEASLVEDRKTHALRRECVAALYDLFVQE